MEREFPVSSTLEKGVEVALDLSVGLSNRPLRIPSKYFYDDEGSALFDAICDLPEYYPTRTERVLLEGVAGRVAALAPTSHLVELGAGTARKTGSLVRALLERDGGLRYTPLDISQYALDEAAESLGRAFPGLRIDGIRCDYTESLDELEPDPECLVAFLGSTIGNFEHHRGVALLRRLRSRLAPGDGLLLGVDLVKEVEVLEAAYNDSRGITARFNKNILEVVNREAGGDFDTGDFRHLAFFDEEESRIEMHLVARRDVQVRLDGLDLALEIEEGERIRTEISRKFTEKSAAGLLRESGFAPRRWFESDDGYFGLALARAADEPGTEAKEDV